MATLLSKTKIFVKRMQTSNNSGTQVWYEEDPNGYIGAIKEVYDNDEIIITIMCKALEMNFEEKKCQFQIREFVYSPASDTWGEITGKRGKYRNNTIYIDNNTLLYGVNYTDGNGVLHPQGSKEIQPNEENSPYLIGEYDFWLAALGKPYIFDPIQNEMLTR